MADVAAKPRGFRAKLGFGAKDDAPRKLVKNTIPRDDAITVNSVNVERRFSDGMSERKMLVSFGRKPSGDSGHESHFGRSWTNGQRQENAPTKTRAPRKLLKAPKHVPKGIVLDKDTGERKDLTEMLHAFNYNDATDHIQETAQPLPPEYDPSRSDGAFFMACVPIGVWLLISAYLTPLDLAQLSSTCKAMHDLLIKTVAQSFRDPINLHHRQTFLLSMDLKLPNHLFCFPCSQWHIRTHPGSEILKPSSVLNPLFTCPNSTNNLLPPSRLRLTDGRTLPFTFVQLAKRHWAHGPTYGIPIESLARRWKDPYSPWTHESKYHIHTNSYILLRLKSQVYVTPGMTPAAKRLLLFSRSDYTPYFSVCAHWRSGILTEIPKCALDHIPVPETTVYGQLRARKAPGPVTLCEHCRPMRRCPDCPSEYLFEIKLVEDRTVKGMVPERFKLALCVTRWSDLGSAVAPEDREWAAVTGGGEEYDSFKEIGRRAVSGVFESAFSDAVPGQRILSMRPEGEGWGRGGEDNGDDWY
ncbi:hypothetical protein K458DRAFT_412048 [Lentithecium fluviatile CBS 122367]|uniref:F-box domain-containing protein n=1 Tax=Lentithecium fluviatile CBS 122367 TaxID=1168545 RepID=A0A6G1JJH1_9PLEO|nr:hypothetical protein K458DRAFT_412048 [Lentithecium fluviatile CBS 122367]